MICADGCDPAYIEAGLAAGVLPTVARWRRDGFYALCDAAMPTFTNPNNLSIVTGAPPAVHGISGNFALDRDSGAEIMMTDPEMVRGDTILGRMSQEGVAVAAVTAKDKLRRMLGKGIAIGPGSRNGGHLLFLGAGRSLHTGRTRDRRRRVLWSAVRSRICIRPICHCSCSTPASGSSSRDAPNCLYLSLSDYVQHGHAPDEPEALDFHAALDERLARLEALGCTVALTADHGMNDKARSDGRPHVIFLEDVLNAHFGAGAVRVICPITDPFVRHHGALGSFVRVYRRKTVPLATLAHAVRALPGIDAVLTRDEAAALWELPRDREADLVVTGDRNTVIGASEAEHDLSALAGHRLRSHGGAFEQTVPFLLSRPLSARISRGLPPPHPPQAEEGNWGRRRLSTALPSPGLTRGSRGREGWG